MMKSMSSLLSQYIQIDTSTTNGNEKKGLLFMQSLAESYGLFTFYHETAPSKGNLVISIRKEDLQPFYDEVYYRNNQRQGTPFMGAPTVLLSHVDVVDARKEDWTYPPFSGAIVDGEIWGRGAIDAKQIGISHLAVMKNLIEVPLKQPLLQIITSEEESGSEEGLKKLLSDYPFLWKGATVWNEGGGFLIEIEGKLFYLVETGQKGNMSFSILLHPKKSPNPYLPSNEVDLLAYRIIQAIEGLRLPHDMLPTSVKKMFSLIADELTIDYSATNYEILLNRIPEKYNRMFTAMMKSTFTLTSLHGGRRNEELKEQYRLTFDARPLPGVKFNSMLKAIEETVHTIEPTAVVEWNSQNEGYDREFPEEMRIMLEASLELSGIDACVVPFMTIGSNDGRYFQSHNATVLGYCPMTPDITFDQVITRVHGVDERIAVKDLEFGISQLTQILKKTMEVTL